MLFASYLQDTLCNRTSRVADLHVAAEDQIHEALDLLDEYRRAPPAAQLRRREQVLFPRHAPNGILRVPSLRPHARPTQPHVDEWMHILAVNGVINLVLFHCRMAWGVAGVPCGSCHGYVAELHYPPRCQRW